jgi:elongation factor Ts
MASIEQIKELRQKTGVSVMQCRKALEEAEGDMEKAAIILRKLGSKAAAKKADRELGSGVVQAYIHSNNQVGVLIELNCETDFVAKNESFLELANNIAMHVAAMNPEYLSEADISDEKRAAVTDVMKSEVESLDKPDDIKAKVLEGKVNDFLTSSTLMAQPFVKNPEMTISQLIEESIQKLGEKIELARFVRYTVLEG